jgi:Uma2 family endonuclease
MAASARYFSSVEVPPIDPNRIYTIEEYLELPDDGNIYELLEGKLIVSPQPGDDHSSVAHLLSTYLGMYNLTFNVGKFWNNGRFVIERGNKPDGKDTELAPDVGFIAHPHVPPASPGAIPIPPHLAIKIQSPNNTLPEMRDKVKVYLRAGVKEVWLIHPSRRTATIYRQGSLKGEALPKDGTLNGGKILPGFQLPIAKLFES